MSIKTIFRIGALLAVGWIALRYWDCLLVAWRWSVAAGAGLVVALTSTGCLLFVWLVVAELLRRRKVDDWPDSLLGSVAIIVFVGVGVWATWHFRAESDGFFTTFFPRAAAWSAVAGLVPVTLDSLFGRRRTHGQMAADGAVGSARPRTGGTRKSGRYYLTPDGRMTRRVPPRVLADVVVDLDVGPDEE